MPDQDALQALRTYAGEKLRDNFAQLQRCARLLTTEQLWSRPNDHVNSVANLLLHLTGNVRQWIVAGIGGVAFDRDRPAEFAARAQRSADELLPALADVVQAAIRVISDMTATDMAKSYQIQGYDVVGIVAVTHVVEHFSFHTGQIVHATKWLRNVDLSLYDEQGRKLTGGSVNP